MRLRSILSEAMRNIAAGTSRAALMALAVALAGGLLGGYEAVSVIGLEHEAVTRISSNADVKTIVGGQVDGVSCDALADVDGGPSASGAMRIGPQITMASTPRSDLSSYEVTPGMLRLLAAGSGATGAVDSTGVWVSNDVAKDFGLSVGSTLETTAGTSKIAGVFDWPNDGRDTRLAYAFVTPASPSSGTFEECWAKQWPASDELDGLLYDTTIVSSADTGAMAGVSQLNKGFDAHYDANASYQGRLTRWMPFAGLAVGMLLGVISVRRRRLEYAGALHCGQSKGAQLLGIGAETVVWAGLGTLVAVALLVAYGVRWSASGPEAVILASVRTPLAVFAGAMLAAPVAGLFVRESQLFRFFKNR